MNPNQSGQKPLDPNLQAAYDRVMGIDASGNTTTQPVVPGPTQPTPAPQAPTIPDEPAIAPAPPMPSEPTTSPAIPQPLPPTAPEPSPIPPTEPPIPTLPTTPITPSTPSISPVPEQMPSISATETPPASTTEDTAPASGLPAMEGMNASMSLPQIIPHETTTVKIGSGGFLEGNATKPKSKGLSPVILILGTFVFLLVYALFWIRFFNLPLPFIGK